MLLISLVTDFTLNRISILSDVTNLEICFSNTDEKKIYRKGIGAQNVCMTINPLILRQIWNDYRYTVKNFVAAA